MTGLTLWRAESRFARRTDASKGSIQTNGFHSPHDKLDFLAV
nr:MAG TPA: hypothetical protein [Caudoviricetes sp.]